MLVVDTDAWVSGQIDGHPEISPDATIDTLRVDVVDGSHVVDFRDFVAPDPSDWPLSFGVTAPATPHPVRIRLRAFRGFFASPGMLGDTATLEPPKEVTIDRLIELPQVASGVMTVRVLLAEDCLGVPSSSLDATTCVDAGHTSAPLGSGLEPVTGDAPASVVGTWPGAVEVPCSGSPPPGSVCIPGGFSVLGELSFSGITDGNLLLDSTPLHPVRLSPFYMDATEFTVDRLRKLHGFPASMSPTPPSAATASGDQDLAFCTWTPSSNGDLPVNCIQWAAAKLACSLSGGTLPTEAQWEHAARGRGQRRLYPWGDEGATCCFTSASRVGVPSSLGGPPVECSGSGIEAVGSHPSSTCDGLGDVSRDGILDLGGSETELLVDHAAPFDAPCWATPGIATDPACLDPSFADQSVRGGYWNGGLAVTLSPLRQIGPQTSGDMFGSPSYGFRCVYPGGT